MILVYIYTCIHIHFRHNILLDGHLHAKLGDFGFAYEIPEVKGRTMVMAPTFARTLCPRIGAWSTFTEVRCLLVWCSKLALPD